MPRVSKRKARGTSSAEAEEQFEVGQAVLTFHGLRLFRSHIVKHDSESNQYLVHIKGWNKRHDSWIPPERICVLTDDNLAYQQELENQYQQGDGKKRAQRNKGEASVVEAIIGRRQRKGKGVEYRIRWEGYGSDEDSWEPEGNLACPDRLAEWEAANRNKQVKVDSDSIENPQASKRHRPDTRSTSSGKAATAGSKKRYTFSAGLETLPLPDNGGGVRTTRNTRSRNNRNNNSAATTNSRHKNEVASNTEKEQKAPSSAHVQGIRSRKKGSIAVTLFPSDSEEEQESDRRGDAAVARPTVAATSSKAELQQSPVRGSTRASRANRTGRGAGAAQEGEELQTFSPALSPSKSTMSSMSAKLWKKLKGVLPFSQHRSGDKVEEGDDTSEQDKMLKALMRWKNHTVARCFNSWKSFVALKKLDLKLQQIQEREGAVSSAAGKDEGNDAFSSPLSIGLLPLVRTNTLKKRTTQAESYAGRCGLRNLGNTCYMNSVLQALSNARVFRDYYYYYSSINEEHKVPKNDTERMGTDLYHLFKGLWGGKNALYTPDHVLRTVWALCSRFAGFKQQDAQEFSLFLLNQLSLEEEESKGSNRPTRRPNTVRSRIKDDFIKTTLGGSQTNQILCLQCGHTSCHTTEFIGPLSVQIPPEDWEGLTGPDANNAHMQHKGRHKRIVSLADCLRYTFKGVDRLDGDNKYKCPGCKTMAPAEKSTYISRLPSRYLIVHISRTQFSMKTFTSSKNQALIDFPLKDIDLTTYAFPPGDSAVAEKRKKPKLSKRARRKQQEQEQQQEEEEKQVGLWTQRARARSRSSWVVLEQATLPPLPPSCRTQQGPALRSASKR